MPGARPTGTRKDPEYRKEYDALEEEFALAAEVAKARSRAGLSRQSWRGA
jgi:hypothetical protein